MSQSLPADPLPALVQDADRLHELRELDATVAERVMGWRWWMFGIEGVVGGAWARYLAEGEARDGDRPCPSNSDHAIVCINATSDVPQYSSDWSAIRLVEDEIERRGLGMEYVRHLLAITLESHGWQAFTVSSDEEMWRTNRASCEQRCKAALSVCGALHDRRTDANGR